MREVFRRIRHVWEITLWLFKDNDTRPIAYTVQNITPWHYPNGDTVSAPTLESAIALASSTWFYGEIATFTSPHERAGLIQVKDRDGKLLGQLKQI